MSVTCRRQDKERFEELGFQIEFGEDQNAPVIEMIDEEANYAHADSMPTNIPYIAWHGAGSNYGDGKIACDGKEFVEVAANNDGFVVDWNFETQSPKPHSLERVRNYLVVHQRAKQLLKELRQTKTQP